MDANTPQPELMHHISDSIDLARFERENRRRLSRCFLLAVGVLAFLAVYSPPLLREVRETPQTLYRTIVTDIIEMPIQHYSEPFLIRKPQHHRTIRRQATGMRLPSGRIATKQAPLPGEDTLTLIEPEISAIPESADSLRRQSSLPPEPEYKAGITRRPERHFSLSEEGLNLADLDSLGIYKGFVIQDPTDKRKVKGFVYIPRVVQGIPLGPQVPNGQLAYGLGSAFDGLSEAVNHFTGISQRTETGFSLADRNLFQYPIIYLTSASVNSFQLSSTHLNRLREFLRKGGFAIFDNGSPWKKITPAKASLLNILMQAAGTKRSLNRFPTIPFSIRSSTWKDFFRTGRKIKRYRESCRPPISGVNFCIIRVSWRSYSELTPTGSISGGCGWESGSRRCISIKAMATAGGTASIPINTGGTNRR